jgi:rRNA maturation endonuclease Nob1
LRGEQKSEASLVCLNCRKELQKEWKVCPYCGTQVATTGKASGSAANSAAQASYDKGKNILMLTFKK